MTHLKGFTLSLAESPAVNATMERWMYGTGELQRKMSEQIVSLCRYFDRIPEESMADYMEVLCEALDDEKLGSGFLKSEHLDRSMENFIDHLKSLDDPEKVAKAGLICDKVHEKFKIDE